MTGNKLLVMLGYGEDFGLEVRCLCFRTEQMPTDEACEVVKIVKGYNAFDGQKVAKIIKEIAALWPSTYQQVRFSFGRENSPVLYVHFPYWKSQTEQFERREELIRKSLSILKEGNPDELEEMSRDCYGARAWWD